MEDSPQKICHTVGETYDPTPPPPTPTPIPRPNSPTSTPPTPTPPTPNPRPQPPRPNPRSYPLPTSTPLTPTYHRCVANLPLFHCCKRLSDAYDQILGHIRMSHPLCGESSGNRLKVPCSVFNYLVVAIIL